MSENQNYIMNKILFLDPQLWILVDAAKLNHLYQIPHTDDYHLYCLSSNPYKLLENIKNACEQFLKRTVIGDDLESKQQYYH
jgi:hypothetical protein